MRAQCDDREALESLLRSIQPSLRRFVHGVVGPTNGDDVLQEVFVTVCRKLKSLHAPELLRPWVYRIASREAFRQLKKERRWPGPSAEAFDFDDLPAPGASRPAEVLEELLALDEVPAASRMVLSLHFREELTLLEVAAILELPLGTVKSRLNYGLNAIRKHLRKKRGER